MNGGERQQTCGLVRRTAVRAARARDRCPSYAPVPPLRARQHREFESSSLENNIYSILGTLMSTVHTGISSPLTSVRYERFHQHLDTDRCGHQQQRACHHCCQRQEPREPIALGDELIAPYIASVLFAAHQLLYLLLIQYCSCA